MAAVTIAVFGGGVEKFGNRCSAIRPIQIQANDRLPFARGDFLQALFKTIPIEDARFRHDIGERPVEIIQGVWKILNRSGAAGKREAFERVVDWGWFVSEIASVQNELHYPQADCQPTDLTHVRETMGRLLQFNRGNQVRIKITSKITIKIKREGNLIEFTLSL